VNAQKKKLKQDCEEELSEMISESVKALNLSVCKQEFSEYQRTMLTCIAHEVKYLNDLNLSKFN